MTLLELFANDYLEGPESTCTHDGKLYSVDKLIAYTRFVPEQLVPLYELEWMLEIEGQYFDPQRVDSANLDYPVIVTKWETKLVSLDGFHRVCKAIKEGHTHIKAKIVHDFILRMCEIGGS